MNARQFCLARMREYNFREDAIELIDSHTVFTMDDPAITSGGGYCRFGYGWMPTFVHLNTAQHEAAVHECGHAWWFLLEKLEPSPKDDMVEKLLRAFERQADHKPGRKRYHRVRELCHEYKYGTEGWSGMWMPDLNRWNHDEIFAGLLSGTMGSLKNYPKDFKSIYSSILTSGSKVYIPLVVS